MIKLIDCPADIIHIILHKCSLYNMTLLCKKFAQMCDKILIKNAKIEWLDQINTKYINLAHAAEKLLYYMHFDRYKNLPGYHHYYKITRREDRDDIQKYKSLCKKLKFPLDVTVNKYSEFGIFLTNLSTDNHVYNFEGNYKIVKKIGIRCCGSFKMRWNSNKKRIILLEESIVVTKINISFGKQAQKLFLDIIKDFFYEDMPEIVSSEAEFYK